MEISAGLASTAASIQRAQVRFDNRAQQVVADAQALSSDQPDVAAENAAASSASSLPADLVGMQADALVNRILYGVFQRQQQQQADLADIIKPKG